MRPNQAGNGVWITRVCLRWDVEAVDPDVDCLPLGADADREDRHLRLEGCFDGRLGRCAGVLPAVAEDHDSRQRRVAFLMHQLLQSVSQPCFRTGGGECRFPLDFVCSVVCSVVARRIGSSIGRIAAGWRQLIEFGEAMNVFVESQHNDVVRTAQCLNEIGLPQPGGHLFRPARTGAGQAGIHVGKAHAGTGIHQQEYAGVADQLLFGSPLRLQIEYQQEENRAYSQGGQRPSENRVEFPGVQTNHLPGEQRHRGEYAKRQDPIGVRLDAPPPEDDPRGILGKQR